MTRWSEFPEEKCLFGNRPDQAGALRRRKETPGLASLPHLPEASEKIPEWLQNYLGVTEWPPGTVWRVIQRILPHQFEKLVGAVIAAQMVYPIFEEWSFSDEAPQQINRGREGVNLLRERLRFGLGRAWHYLAGSSPLDVSFYGPGSKPFYHLQPIPSSDEELVVTARDQGRIPETVALAYRSGLAAVDAVYHSRDGRPVSTNQDARAAIQRAVMAYTRYHTSLDGPVPFLIRWWNEVERKLPMDMREGAQFVGGPAGESKLRRIVGVVGARHGNGINDIDKVFPPLPPKVVEEANDLIREIGGEGTILAEESLILPVCQFAPALRSVETQEGIWSIEAHTLGCRYESLRDRGEGLDEHWEIFDDYEKHPNTIVYGSPDDFGTFITITFGRKR